MIAYPALMGITDQYSIPNHLKMQNLQSILLTQIVDVDLTKGFGERIKRVPDSLVARCMESTERPERWALYVKYATHNLKKEFFDFWRDMSHQRQDVLYPDQAYEKYGDPCDLFEQAITDKIRDTLLSNGDTGFAQTVEEIAGLFDSNRARLLYDYAEDCMKNPKSIFIMPAVQACFVRIVENGTLPDPMMTVIDTPYFRNFWIDTIARYVYDEIDRKIQEEIINWYSKKNTKS